MQGICSLQIVSLLLVCSPLQQRQFQNRRCPAPCTEAQTSKVRPIPKLLHATVQCNTCITSCKQTCSERGVLNTLSLPKRCNRPAVHLNTPPKLTSSPNTSALMDHKVLSFSITEPTTCFDGQRPFVLLQGYRQCIVDCCAQVDLASCGGSLSFGFS